MTFSTVSPYSILPDQTQTQPARRIVLWALASNLHLPCLSMTLFQSPSTVGNTPSRIHGRTLWGRYGSAPNCIYPFTASNVSTNLAPIACAIIDRAASVVGLIIRACCSSFCVLRRKVHKQHVAPSVTVTQLAHVRYFTRSLAALPA